MRRKTLVIGHQAPKGIRSNNFNSIEIDGDLHYCITHNFVYNAEDEKKKLYDGLPCYYTDIRFADTRHNSYKNTKLHWTRWKDISLKACIRKTLSCKNIPVGTIVDFKSSYYYTHKKADPSFKFKIKKENNLDIQYEINAPSYSDNFKTCEFSKNLTDALRANGFIVSVQSKNTNFISGMIATAAAYVGKDIEADEEEGETAQAYGYGKRIGFSSKDNSFYGYSNGCANILWDRFGEFDKWSRCNQITKTSSIEEILDILKQPNDVEVEEII